jgi:hypothetical protein
MSEGKFNEGKSSENDDILELVQEFCMSDSFEREFEMFAKEHSHVFEKALDYTVHSSEHPIEFHNAYLEYIKKFEGLIEDFIVKVQILWNSVFVDEFHFFSLEWIHAPRFSEEMPRNFRRF